METVWNINTTHKFEKIKTPKDFDVVIVGGGLTALLTAYFLKDTNYKIGVICDTDFTQSASARSNAKITSVNTTLYSDIAKNYGNDKALFFYEDKTNAIASYYKIINDFNMDCDFETTPSYVYSTTDEGKRKLAREMQFFKQNNIEYTEHYGRLEDLINIKNAYEFKEQYTFNPVKFMQNLISIIERYNNITFYENSPVKKITNNYLIANTQKITFKKVVVATHYPPFKFLGQFPFKMYQEKATLASFNTTTPLSNMYVSVDYNDLSLRPLNSNTMILVANNHRTGSKSSAELNLKDYANKNFENVQNFKLYSNQDCVTFDGLPFIDTACIVLPNVYVATGYNLFGITTSIMSAKHICNNIMFDKNMPTLYSRNRFNFNAQKQENKKHLKTIMYEFTHRKNKLDGKTYKDIKNLKNGEGFTFKHKMKYIGVSKHNDELYFILNKCPHLGCPLHYNQDTQTWDCGCHGSSFKPNGQFIFSPTNKNLQTLDYLDFKIKP